MAQVEKKSVNGTMYTRTQYLNKEVTFEEYYGQFVDSYTKRLVPASLEEIREAYQKDKHLSNIPLKRWDERAVYVNHWELGVKLKEANEVLTLAVQVCILKQSARELLKEHKKVKVYKNKL